MISRRSLLTIASVALISACGDARRTITERAPELALRVQVQPAPALSAAARELSWSPEGVPGASVIATKITSELTEPASEDTVQTDALGIARFTGLSLGRYTLRVVRAITASERASAPSLGDAEEIVGLSEIALVADGETLGSVFASPTGGSSLLITEIFPSWPQGPSGQQYYFGGYLEIYNNSDTTIALAGKAFLSLYSGYLRGPLRPDGCSIFAAIERDPLNVWAEWVYRFPGNARALLPGESAVLATDALDHRNFGRAGFFDLSAVAFEFKGTADVDNPNVPNMIADPARPFEADGHGWRFRGSRQVWALASALEPDTLVRWRDPVFGGLFTKISAAALLDIVRYDWDEPNVINSITFCPSAIASNIDAADAVLLKVEDTLAIHRRVARILPNGRVIYQRSRNSAADWIAGRATPGQVP